MKLDVITRLIRDILLIKNDSTFPIYTLYFMQRNMPRNNKETLFYGKTRRILS